MHADAPFQSRRLNALVRELLLLDRERERVDLDAIVAGRCDGERAPSAPEL
jgi:hypothetical protein